MVSLRVGGAQCPGGLGKPNVYDSLAEFLTTFSRSYPVAWALLVMLGIASTALALYGFWEVVLRAVLSGIRRGGHR